MKPDGTCHAFNGEGRCTKELIIGQKPFIDWYDRANPEMNNYNWEMFITEDGYEGRAPKRPVLISVLLPVLLPVSLLAPLSVLLPVQLPVQLLAPLLAPLLATFPVLLPVHSYIFSRS